MNNQQVDHVLTFYRINFGFHDPYKFLLDGNFIKLILEKQVDFKKRLQNAITGKTKFYVPSCLIRQLQLLGNDFKLVLEKAKQFKKVSCKHALQISVDQCIIQNFIGAHNPQKYIVCTQDIELRRQLRQVLSCPLMYFGPDQRIKFEDVHKKSVAMIERQAKQKLLPKQNELGQINEYKKQMKKREQQQKRRQKLRLASELGIKLKTKVARGPNPLSIKKRQVRAHEVSYQRDNRGQQQQNEQVINGVQQRQLQQQDKQGQDEQNDVDNSKVDINKKKRIRKKKNKNKDIKNTQN